MLGTGDLYSLSIFQELYFHNEAILPRIVFLEVFWNFLNLNNEGKGRVGAGSWHGADASKIAFSGMRGISHPEELKWTPFSSILPLTPHPDIFFSLEFLIFSTELGLTKIAFQIFKNPIGHGRMEGKSN